MSFLARNQLILLSLRGYRDFRPTSLSVLSPRSCRAQPEQRKVPFGGSDALSHTKVSSSHPPESTDLLLLLWGALGNLLIRHSRGHGSWNARNTKALGKALPTKGKSL